MLTKPIVVETARPFEPASHSLKYSSGGALKSSFGTARVGMIAAQRLAPLLQVRDLRRVLVRADRASPCLRRLFGNRNVEALHEMRRARRRSASSPGGWRCAPAPLPSAIALHGLGQDHRRAALVLHRALVGVVDLRRIVAAAVQALQAARRSCPRPAPAARDICRRIPARMYAPSLALKVW